MQSPEVAAAAEPAAAAAEPPVRSRARAAIRTRHAWLQLAQFCVVGASGYAVNLAVYWLLLHVGGLHYTLAATGSFLVAASWNYSWNRSWTFRAQRGHFGYQGLRFFTVSGAVYGANLVLLTLLVEVGHVGKLTGQAIAIVLVTPLNFLGNKLWSFKH